MSDQEVTYLSRQTYVFGVVGLLLFDLVAVGFVEDAPLTLLLIGISFALLFLIIPVIGR